MMINRTNYEEFFLLYADGELSAADKQAVELFVQEHTDLADELVLFQQTRLPAEAISFADKNSLYRFSAADLNAANCEEQFLLYVDNELDDAAKEKVEVFVLQHPAYQEPFTRLKQTKLPAETIAFADKSSLYRKEEKKPVVYLYWKRIAIAAVLMGLIVLTGKLLPDHTAKQSLAGTAVTNNDAPKNNIAATNQGSLPEQPTAAIILPSNSNTTASIQAKQGAVEMNMPNTVPDNLIASNNNPVVPPAEKKTEINTSSLPAITGTVEAKAENIETAVASNNNSSNTDISKLVNTIPAEENTTANTLAHTTAYKELDTDDDKKSLYLGSLEINKDKLRGLFRKASAIFRSKAKQEEDNKIETSPRNLK